MNIIKIQKDFLEALVKKQKVVFCKGVDGKIGVSDQKAIYFIPTEDMFLDIDKCNAFFDASSLIKPKTDAYQVQQTGDDLFEKGGVKIKVKHFEGDKTTYYGCAGNETTRIQCYVDKKYLAYFGKDERYYAIGPKDPLYVTDDDMELLAIILPVNMGVKS